MDEQFTDARNSLTYHYSTLGHISGFWMVFFSINIYF